jgi:hypothetical protein
MDRRPNPEFEAEMAAFEQTLTREPAVVVYFTRLRGEVAGESARDLMSQLSLRVRDEQPDGLILCAAVCPE